jgi:hypothetical protein
MLEVEDWVVYERRIDDIASTTDLITCQAAGYVSAYRVNQPPADVQ